MRGDVWPSKKSGRSEEGQGGADVVPSAGGRGEWGQWGLTGSGLMGSELRSGSSHTVNT